jgi:hypothetical protein
MLVAYYCYVWQNYAVLQPLLSVQHIERLCQELNSSIYLTTQQASINFFKNIGSYWDELASIMSDELELA